MKVIWSNHALERLAERFPGVTTSDSPDDLFVAIAERKPPNETFRVRVKGIVFIASRTDDGIVLVVTVHGPDHYPIRSHPVKDLRYKRIKRWELRDDDDLQD